MNIFERASRAKIRFQSTKGYMSIEDLWDLSLTSLDTIAKATNKKLKEEAEESFIEEKSEKNTELELQMEILKHVISAKKTAQEASKKASETKAKIDRIQELILQKKDQELSGKSIEELQAEINTLRA